jgi:hypothetical protein
MTSKMKQRDSVKINAEMENETLPALFTSLLDPSHELGMFTCFTNGHDHWHSNETEIFIDQLILGSHIL